MMATKQFHFLNKTFILPQYFFVSIRNLHAKVSLSRVYYVMHRSTSKQHLYCVKKDVFQFWIHLFFTVCYLLHFLQLFDAKILIILKIFYIKKVVENVTFQTQCGICTSFSHILFAVKSTSIVHLGMEDSKKLWDLQQKYLQCGSR